MFNALRSIGITLVVLGHTLGIGETLDKYIFSFHMPLFFFLSGLVLTESRLAQGWFEAGRHYARRLLLPYFLFSLMTWLPWVLVTRHYGADAALNVPAWKPLIGTFYGIGVDGWLQHNAMLWFFPCLFVVHALFRMLRGCRGAGWGLGVLASVILGEGAANLPWRLPWCVEIALLALPFYAVGHALSRKIECLPRRGTRAALMMPVFAAIQWGCIAFNSRVDMNFLSLGNPFLFYVGAFAGIGVLVCLVVFLPWHGLYARVADASILVYPLHRVLFSVFSALGLWLVDDFPTFKLTPWCSLIYTVGAIGVSVTILPWVRRFFPVLVGGR